MKRKIFSLALGLVLVLSMCMFPAQALAVSTEDAVSWLYKQSGVGYDLDGYYGMQCPDLVSAYMNWLVDGDPYSGRYRVYNANYYPTVASWEPDVWEVIANTPEFVPQPGDIFVSRGLASYGHTGIVLSSTVSKATVIDQNSVNANEVTGSPAYIHDIVWSNSYAATHYIRYRGYQAKTAPSLDFGKDLYVYLMYSGGGSRPLYLKNDSSNATDYGKVTTGLWNGGADSRYIWHCVRDQNNTYTIINEYDGRRLDVYCGKDEDRTAIGLWDANGQAPQLWRFYQQPGLPASTFAMMPDSSSSRTRVADINNGSTDPGGVLQLYSQNHSPAQCFCMYEVSAYSKPARPGAPQTISASSESGGKTTISWSSVPAVNKYDMRGYEVVVDGAVYTTRSTSISLSLSPGSHSVKVRSVNTNYWDHKSAYTSKTVSAAETSRTVTVTVRAGSGVGGRVSGGGTYTDSEFITVTAEPWFGYQFKEWQQNGKYVCNSAVFSFKTTVNQDLTAVFEKLPDDYINTGWIPEPQ